MTIRYKCEECNAVLNIKDELAGTQGHCPRCQVEFTVPAPEGTVLPEKKPAAVARGSSTEAKSRPAGAFGDDDIVDILGSGGPGSSSPGSAGSVAENEFDKADNPFADEPRQRRKPQLEESDANDEEIDRSKKKKRSGKEPAAKGDSAESASIAKDLMGRGDHTAAPPEKKRGRMFGGAGGGGPHQEGEFTAKEVVAYFAQKGAPILLGGLVFMGICYWISSSLMTGVALPPLASVTGTVTLDGKPLPNAIVSFQPIVEGTKPNFNLATSVSFTDANGKYELLYTTVNEKKYWGAVIGKHMVTIVNADPNAAVQLPPQYSSTASTTLNKEVVKGAQTIDFPLLSAPTK